jgi:hypothetical protein
MPWPTGAPGPAWPRPFRAACKLDADIEWTRSSAQAIRRPSRPHAPQTQAPETEKLARHSAKVMIRRACRVGQDRRRQHGTAGRRPQGLADACCVQNTPGRKISRGGVSRNKLQGILSSLLLHHRSAKDTTAQHALSAGFSAPPPSPHSPLRY